MTEYLVKVFKGVSVRVIDLTSIYWMSVCSRHHSKPQNWKVVSKMWTSRCFPLPLSIPFMFCYWRRIDCHAVVFLLWCLHTFLVFTSISNRTSNFISKVESFASSRTLGLLWIIIIPSGLQDLSSLSKAVGDWARAQDSGNVKS